MDRPVTLYTLCDPDGTPRYIGQTSKTLEQRLYQHLHEPRYHWSRSFPRCVWIAGLLASGQCPLIKVLVVVEAQHADALEREYIARYLADGYNLVNGTHTPQTRAKMTAVNRAHWARWKAREREHAAARAATMPAAPAPAHEQEGTP